MTTPRYDWWIASAHTDSALLLLMRDEREFERLISDRYVAVHGRGVSVDAIQGAINQAKWRAVYEPDRFAAMSAILSDITVPAPPEPALPFEPTQPADRRGVDIPIGELRGGWLYVEPFWAPAHVFTSDDETFERIIASCKRYGNICVSVLNFVGGDEYSPKFFGTDHPGRVVERLRRIDEAGLANVVFGMGNDYLRYELGFPSRASWYEGLLRTTRRMADLVRSQTSVFIPLTERGKTLTSLYNETRHEMYVAAREGMGDRGVIGAHELPGEGVYFEDLKHCGDVMACIQTGFDRSETQIREWIRDDSVRWRDLDDRGNFAGRAWYCAMEHSIPAINPQRWRHSHTWLQARLRGRAALDAGADLDFSGGQVK